MSYFATNLKVLRKRKLRSQQAIADFLDVSRSTYAEWERGNSEPPLNTIVMLSGYHGIAVDRLLKQDLSKLGEYHIGVLERRMTELTYIDGKLDPVK